VAKATALHGWTGKLNDGDSKHQLQRTLSVVRAKAIQSHKDLLLKKEREMKSRDI
jgi:hypothetical protein